MEKEYTWSGMRRDIKSNSPTRSPSQDQQSESQKVSYWLEKLFNQARDKENRDAKERSEVNSSDINKISTSKNVEQISGQKGKNDAVRSTAQKTEKDRITVEDMVSNSNRILFRISSVFPWDLFPSIIIAEETRITIIHRQLFSSQVHSVDIKSISNIFIDTDILFAQLTITSNTFAENQITIKRLWKKDAIFMRRIIEGLRMFVNKDIDTTSYTVKDLIKKLEELSTTKIVL